MLEAKDLAGVDQVMPFVFALLDRLCGTTAAAPNTTVCVLHQDMIATATSRFSDPGFTIAELEALSEQISLFKAKAIEVFGVGAVGQLIKIAMLRVKNALPFLEC
jgi:hypothetical protein